MCSKSPEITEANVESVYISVTSRIKPAHQWSKLISSAVINKFINK